MLGTITLTVGQTETMPQKEGSPELIEVQDEVLPETNGEQEETLVTAEETASTEEKVAEEKPTESNEVGFKKIFRFVGFKFTLKKDKNEKIEPVQLLTVKETEDGASEAALEEIKEEPVTAEMQTEDEKEPDASETEKQVSADGDATTNAEKDIPVTDAPAETKADGAEETETDKPAEDVETSTEKEKEPEKQAESPTSPPSQETQSPFRRFFTQGIFSNLRKKTSFKKSKEEEPVKEKSTEEDIKEDEEKEEVAADVEGQVKQDEKEGGTEEQVVKEAEARPEEPSSTLENPKEQDRKLEDEPITTAAPEQEPEITVCEVSSAEEKEETKATDDLKPTDDKTAESSDEQQTSPETITEVQPSQDKTKTQGSPLKKLFTGAGLKKLSSKKQKGKKEPELKQTESEELAADPIQSSTESGEAQKPDSGASSPEESGEHVVGETSQAEASIEAEGEASTSDSEKKKDGLLHWASFKKLVTPKKRVKRPSDSEDEAPGDKPKSATLSSTESAVFEEKTEETKASDEVKEEEEKEESQVECKSETKAEKSEQSTEEPKKKIDTSVSWEALICVGSTKKRARKTSDSDEEETKIEEEVQQSGEEQAKTVQSPIESSQETEREHVASSPEPEGELVSTWESFKRMVTHRKKPKAEDKSDEAQVPEQAVSDSELPKEESSFSLRKLIPRRKKKSDMKQASSDVGSAEDDSDTPAVVPLSEYEIEQSEIAKEEEEEEEEEKKTENGKPEVTPVTPVTPGKASAEDRSPSWISATVENVEDEADGKPLSDIPEEGDTAATPKSTDNTIAEDIVEFTSEAVTAIEPAEETEMVSALSRITESPDTSGETSPVPDDGVVKKTEAILQEAVETISVTSSIVTVTEEKQQTNNMVVSTVPFQVETAIKEEKVVLAVHQKSEAIAICTGLDTSVIKAVEEETPLTATLEAVSSISDAISVEVATENQTLKPDEAEVVEAKVFALHVNEVQTECKPVEHTEDDHVEIHTTCESKEETGVIKVEASIQQETELLEKPAVAEDVSMLVAETTVEPPALAQMLITEISEAVDEAQKLEDVTESVASAELESAEVAVAVAEEVAASIPDTLVAEMMVSSETSIPVHVATQEIVVTEEAVCVCPPSDFKTEAVDQVVTEILTSHVSISTHVLEVSNISTGIDEHMESMQLKEAEAIKEQSTVIVQEVIQIVVENLSEIHKEPESEEKSEEVKSLEEEAKSKEECTVNTLIQEETKPESENKAEEEPRQIITENLPISEADQDDVTEEMKPPADEEASSASVEATQLCTEEAVQEVELKKCEKSVKEVQMENEDEKWQVKKDQNEVARETTEILAVDESRPTKPASIAENSEITEESQQALQETKMETSNVGKIHVEKERSAQDAEMTVQEENIKSLEPSKPNEPQTDLEEAQKDISEPGMKGQEESEDPDRQTTEAEAGEVKTLDEKTPKANEEEDVKKETDSITTES